MASARTAEPEWHRVTVRAGQSLADIFHENGLSPGRSAARAELAGRRVGAAPHPSRRRIRVRAGRHRRADADALRPRRRRARDAPLHARRRQGNGRRARDRAAHAGRARRAHALALRGGRAGRHERHDDLEARQRVRLRHRLRAGPARRRQLQRHLRRRLSRRRAHSRRRHHRRDIHQSGQALHRGALHQRGRRDGVLQRGRPPAAQGVPAHAGRVHAHLERLLGRPHASDPRLHARAQGRRLRRADRHADPRRRRRQDHVPRLELGLRQLRHDPAQRPHIAPRTATCPRLRTRSSAST